jgi:hypothetical protein
MGPSHHNAARTALVLCVLAARFCRRVKESHGSLEKKPYSNNRKCAVRGAELVRLHPFLPTSAKKTRSRRRRKKTDPGDQSEEKRERRERGRWRDSDGEKQTHQPPDSSSSSAFLSL